MYHGFCVSCSSLPPPHTHTHLSTGMDLKKILHSGDWHCSVLAWSRNKQAWRPSQVSHSLGQWPQSTDLAGRSVYLAYRSELFPELPSTRECCTVPPALSISVLTQACCNCLWFLSTSPVQIWLTNNYDCLDGLSLKWHQLFWMMLPVYREMSFA